MSRDFPVPGRDFDHLRVLAGDIGARSAGTPSAYAAADYIAGIFRRLGLDAEEHWFDVPACAGQTASVEYRASGSIRTVPAKGVWFSQDAPYGVQGRMRYVGDGSPRFLEGALPGDIVVIARDVLNDYPDDVLYRRLMAKSVGGVIFAGHPRYPEIPDCYYNPRTVAESQPPPTITMKYLDALHMVRQAGGSSALAVTVRKRSSVTPGRCRNIHAVAPGAGGLARESVVVSAHLDSVPGSPGACDDAGGVAAVLSLVRWLADGGLQPEPTSSGGRRAVHFVIFSGHEPGLLGSWHFVHDRKVDPSTLAAVLNFDGIALDMYEFSVRACGLREHLQEMHAWVEELGMDVEWTAGPGGTDCTTFSAFETTTFSVAQSFNNWHHTSGDDLSLCSATSLADAIEMGRRLLDRLAHDAHIPRSYDSPLRESCRAYRAQYGWGCF